MMATAVELVRRATGRLRQAQRRHVGSYPAVCLSSQDAYEWCEFLFGHREQPPTIPFPDVLKDLAIRMYKEGALNPKVRNAIEHVLAEALVEARGKIRKAKQLAELLAERGGARGLKEAVEAVISALEAKTGVSLSARARSDLGRELKELAEIHGPEALAKFLELAERRAAHIGRRGGEALRELAREFMAGSPAAKRTREAEEARKAAEAAKAPPEEAVKRMLAVGGAKYLGTYERLREGGG